MTSAGGFAVGPPADPGEPQVIAAGVRRVLAPNPGLMTGPGTNTYLLGPVDGPVVVVDPGPDDPEHARRLAELCTRIAAIVVTHGHPDHAPGADLLRRLTGAPVAGHPGLDPTLAVDHVLVEGGEVPRGGVCDAEPPGPIVALETPGHAPEHLCLWLPEPGLLLTGDVVMEGSTVVIAPPAGDLGDYLRSLARLRALEPAALAPGHGGLLTDPARTIDAIARHRLGREEQVLEALRASGSPATLAELLPVAYPELEARRTLIATATLWAHLRKLADEGRAEADLPDDPERGRWAPRGGS